MLNFDDKYSLAPVSKLLKIKAHKIICPALQFTEHNTSNTNISKVRRLQNRVARIVSQCFDFNVSSLEIIKSLRWQNVTERRDFLCSILMHKCLYGHAPSYLSDQFVALEAVQDRFTIGSPMK